MECSPSERFSNPTRSRAIASSRRQTSGATPVVGLSLDGDTAACQLKNGPFEGQVVEPVPAVAAAVLARFDIAADRKASNLLAPEVIEADESLELVTGHMGSCAHDPGKPLAQLLVRKRAMASAEDVPLRGHGACTLVSVAERLQPLGQKGDCSRSRKYSIASSLVLIQLLRSAGRLDFGNVLRGRPAPSHHERRPHEKRDDQQ